MVFDKKSKRDLLAITALGVGLGIASKVEAVAKPPIPVVTKVAPVVAVAAPIIGAGIVLRSLNQLSNVNERPVKIRSLRKAKKVIKESNIRRFI